jgi:predicted RNase H-related nuclease YkuK (DUF458 family)
MIFTNSSGQMIGDLTEYISNWLSENESHEVYIGTDSKVRGPRIKYVSVVVLYKRGRGGHVLLATKTEMANKKMSNREIMVHRLWHEVELTHSLATQVLQGVKGLNPKNLKVHLDINPDPQHASSVVHQAAQGYIRSLAIPEENIMSKPGGFAASFAADHYLQNGNEIVAR